MTNRLKTRISFLTLQNDQTERPKKRKKRKHAAKSDEEVLSEEGEIGSSSEETEVEDFGVFEGNLFMYNIR